MKDSPSRIIKIIGKKESSLITSREYFDFADALREVGRRKDALRVYEIMHEIKVPESKKWLVFLFQGQTFFEGGDFASAELCFVEADRLHSVDTVTAVYLASVFTAQEEFEKAIECLKLSLVRAGDHDEVYVNMAINYRALNQLGRAKDCLEKARDFDPSNQDVLLLSRDLDAALQEAE